MKLLLILLTLYFVTGCSTTNGRPTFLGVSALDKEKCVDQWGWKKKRLVYRKCF